MSTPSHSTSESAPSLRVRSLADLVAIIPSLLGFHPFESLVLVLIERDHVVVTARADLCELDTCSAARSIFGPIWERYPLAECVAVAFAEQPDLAWDVLSELEGWLPPGALLDVAHVGGDWWYCDRDAAGVPYDPAASALTAEATYRGIRVLPERAALAVSLAPAFDHGAMSDALADVLTNPPRATVARAKALLAQGFDPTTVLSLEEAAVLAVAAHNHAFAESVLASVTREEAYEAVRLWTTVVRATTAEVAEAATVLLGVASWLAGDGAMVNVCLERAAGLAAESPVYGLLQAIAGSALPPDRWECVRTRLVAA